MRTFILSLCSVLCLSGTAQGDSHFWGSWFSGPTEFSQFAAWVSERDAAGNLVTATVQCADDVPYLVVAWLQGEVTDSETQMQITVDGRPFWLNARYLLDAAEPGWTVVLVPEVIEALRAGSSFTVQAGPRGPATLRLGGSANAIDAALEGCGNGTGYHPEMVDFFTPTGGASTGDEGSASTAEGATIQATESGVPTAVAPEGVPISPDEIAAGWAEQCPTGANATPQAIRYADLDADGIQDVVVDYGQVNCEGAPSVSMMRGLGFCGMHNCTLFVYLSSTYQPGTWPELIQNHMEIPPTFVDNGNTTSLGTSIQGGSCAFAEVCTGVWTWDGQALVFSANQ